MAKNRKKEARAFQKPQEEKERFPGWLLWPVFLFWGFFIFRSYFARFAPDLNSLFVILAPQQYSVSFKVLLGHLFDIAVALAFMFANFALGRMALKVAGFSFPNALEESVFSAGLGMGLLSVYVFLLGVLSLLYFQAVAVFLALAAAAGVYDLLKRPLRKTEPFRDALAFWDVAALSILLLVAALNLAGALSPEIFYDSLIYHLAVPNFYAVEHKIAPMPYNAFSNLPLTHGMIYLAAILLKEGSLAKLVNYSAFALTAAATVGIALRYFSWRVGLWAAVIFCSVFHTMAAAWSVGTEIMLSLFGMLALYSVLIRKASGEKRWLWLAAVFAGLAMGVKYTGLFTAIGVMLVHAFSERKLFPAACKELAVFTMIASLFIAPWLVKNYIYTRDPVYPLMTDVFRPSAGHDTAKLAKFLAESRQKGPFRIADWIASPWNITMGKTPNSEYFTPLFLFMLPVCFLLAASKGTALAWLWTYFLAVWLAWSLSSTMVRFLIPAYPAAGLIISWYLFSGSHRHLKAALKAVALAVCCTGFYWSALVFYSQGRWRPVLGQIPKDEYLRHTQPTYPYSHYAGIEYVNGRLPADSKTLIVGDGRSFYLKKPFMVSTVFDKTHLVEYALASESGNEMYLRMKKDGLTHILLNVAEGVRLARDYGMFYFTPPALAVFDDFWSAHVKEIYSYDEAENGGQVINRIGVYELVAERGPGTPRPFNFISSVIMKGGGAV